MSIWGKIIGGAAGFALGGPLGAILGAAAGAAVDVMVDSDRQPAGDDHRDATREIAFTIGVIVLGAKMAKVDGVVTRDEITAFKQVFRIPAEEEANVGRVFNMARRDARGFEPYAHQLARLLKDRPQVLENLLFCLFHIAKADGAVTPQEIVFLRAVAGIFGMSDSAFERLRETEAGPDEGDPYRILGVGRDASLEEIKTAYRALVRENHPDRLIGRGLPEEFISVANDKISIINAAYDKVLAERQAR